MKFQTDTLSHKPINEFFRIEDQRAIERITITFLFVIEPMIVVMEMVQYSELESPTAASVMIEQMMIHGGGDWMDIDDVRAKQRK